ncbi:hypothetical protein ES703_115344 [subsurface metagenome]
MNDKLEAIIAIQRINNIIHEWEENEIGSRVALELLASDIKTVIPYLERIQERIDNLKKRKII